MITLDAYETDNDTYEVDEKGDAELRKRRREFEDYASIKAREIGEQRMSWRYYHVDQWSTEQLKVLAKRQQPPITFDRTGRKIDSLSGTIRRLRTDPKAYPNTPKGDKDHQRCLVCGRSRSGVLPGCPHTWIWRLGAYPRQRR